MLDDSDFGEVRAAAHGFLVKVDNFVVQFAAEASYLLESILETEFRGRDLCLDPCAIL